MITIYFDGLCEPMNPGGIGCYGYVILQNGKQIKAGCSVIGQGKGMTNNVAEYSALKRALEWIKDEHKIEGEILVKGDSQLVIQQLSGNWEIRSETSKKFVPIIENLIKGKNVSFMWIPREENKKADMLSRVAYKRAVYGKKESEVKKNRRKKNILISNGSGKETINFQEGEKL